MKKFLYRCKKASLSKYIATIFVVLPLTIFLIPIALSLDVPESEKVLDFLEEVVMIDLTRYDVTFVPSDSHIHPGYFKFESSSSNFNVNYAFQDNELVYVELEMHEGTPAYSEQFPNSIFETADLFLQKYLSFTGENLQQKRDVLATITELEDTSITQEDMIFNFQYGNSSKLHTTNSTTFEWINLIDGAPFTSISVSFQDGHFVHLYDSQRVPKIVSMEVTVSKEEAIAITKEAAENWSDFITVGEETVLVSNLTILDEPVYASLGFRSKEDISTLYPWWHVYVYADEEYPDIALGFMASIWADTGEIIQSCLVVGSTIPEFQSWTLLLITVIALVAVIVLFRRRLYKQNQRGKK